MADDDADSDAPEDAPRARMQPAASPTDAPAEDAALAVRSDWIAVAMAAAAELACALEPSKAEALVERAQAAREQVAVLQRYTYICGLLTRYELQLGRWDTDTLVPMRFPVQLLPNTHSKLIDGLQSSFAAFVNEIHRAAITTNVDALEPGAERFRIDTAEFANAMAADLWVQTTRIVNRECGEPAVRARLLSLLDDFARRAVEDERDRLRRLHGHCACLRDACGDFARRRLQGKRGQDAQARQTAARRWLVGAGRGGACAAVRVLARHRRHARLFAQLDVGPMIAAFGSSGPLEDDKAAALYECMERTHADLASAMNWEERRADWLEGAATTTHACWSGVVVAFDSCEHESDERLLQAPSHMGCFATGRLRVVTDPQLRSTAYTCGLARVRVARILAQLLRDGHLPLHRLGCTFARRIATCEFAKYEHAAHGVETDTLVPFGREVGVAYAAGALPSAMHQILSESSVRPRGRVEG